MGIEQISSFSMPIEKYVESDQLRKLDESATYIPPQAFHFVIAFLSHSRRLTTIAQQKYGRNEQNLTAFFLQLLALLMIQGDKKYNLR